MRDVYDNAGGVSRESRAQPGWILQGQLTYAQASAFGHAASFGRSMALVPGQPACSYDRGCEHDHGPDPFLHPDFAAHATVHDWNTDGWTTQQIRDSVATTDVPVQCIYCTFTGKIAEHVCEARLYIEMPIAG